MAELEPIKFSMKRRLNQRGLARLANAAHICAIANRFADGRYEAIKFSDGLLVLRAANAVVLADLRPEVYQLTQRLKGELNWPANQRFEVRLTLLPN